MIENDKLMNEIAVKLSMLLEGDLTVEQFAEFQGLLLHNKQARDYYYRLLAINANLQEAENLVHLQDETQKNDSLHLLNALLTEESSAPAVVMPEIVELPSVEPARGRPQELPPISKVKLISFLMSVAAVLLIGFYVHISIEPSVEVATIDRELNAIYAGRTFIPAGSRLKNSSETIRLVEGLISVKLDSGARVVVESPAEFSLNSSNGMCLYSGSIYAVVDSQQAQGFTVKTPGCDIVDLGTEFGVRVIGGSSEIHMTRGRAQITAGGAGRNTEYLLEAGNARRVELSGQIQNIKLQTDTFARTFSSDTGIIWRGNSVELADIVGGGNGVAGGYYRGMSIDPANGKIVPWAVKSDSYSHNSLLPVNDSVFIDAVFVPDGGDGPIPVSTTGLTWAGPDTSGFYKYNIGAMVEVLDQSDIYAGYAQAPSASDQMLEKAIKGGVPKHLMRIHAGNTPASDTDTNIVMHANVGITFDLAQIRPLLTDKRITGFNSLFGVSEEIVALEKISDADMNIDVWVLIDGQERFSRQDIDATMLTEIDLQIDDQDRFLTLVVTDSGDRLAASFDWGLFFNPRLRIE